LKTLVVEDNTAQREHVERLLRERLPQALPLAWTADGAQAVTRARLEQPELLILDIQLPGANGIEVARAVWKERPATRIVFWSQFKDEIYVRRLSQIVPPETVYGYVLKSSPDEKLLQAIKAVLCDEQCCWIAKSAASRPARSSPPAL